MPTCTHVVDKHFDGYYSLQLMTSGGIFLGYDDQTYTLTEPSAWGAWPGPLTRFHKLDNYPSWNHRYVAFRGGLAARWKNSGLLPSKPLPVADTRLIVSLFDDVLADIYKTGQMDILRSINGVERILLLLHDQQASAQHGDLVSRVVEYLAKTRIDEIDYTDLAAQNYVSQSTLRRRFKDATGMSVHSYAVQHTINRAKILLTQTNEPIKVIARDLGYNDVYYFTRQFSQMVGVPPSQFRKTV